MREDVKNTTVTPTQGLNDVNWEIELHYPLMGVTLLQKQEYVRVVLQSEVVIFQTVSLSFCGYHRTILSVRQRPERL